MRERLAAAAAGVAPGRYQILAAINAVHTSARDMAGNTAETAYLTRRRDQLR